MTKWRPLILILLAFAFVIFMGLGGPLMIYNASAGCFPWSPATVEYHDGMTLCPGQSATIRVPVQKPEPTI